MKALKKSGVEVLHEPDRDSDAAAERRAAQLRVARAGDAEQVPEPAMLQAMLAARLAEPKVRRLPLAVSLPVSFGASVALWAGIVQIFRSFAG
jgi:hypothetical protein